jgi:hypothetical protein
VANPDKIMLVRFVGSTECPDWDDHPANAIYAYCVKPLFLKFAIDAEMEYLEMRLKEPAC